MPSLSHYPIKVTIILTSNPVISFVTLWALYKWNHRACNSFVAAFAKHYVCGSLHIVAHSNNLLILLSLCDSLYLSTQMLRNSALFSIYSNLKRFTVIQIVLLKIFLYIYFGEHIYKFLFGIYPGVKIAGHRVWLYPNLWDTTKLFVCQ